MPHPATTTPSPAVAPARRSLWAAALFALGLIVASELPPISSFPWLGIATGAAMLGALARANARRALLCLAAVALGAGWFTLRALEVPADDLSRRLDPRAIEPTLATVRGIVLTDPEPLGPAASPLARFLPRNPAARFELRAHAIEGPDDTLLPASGDLWATLLTDSPPAFRAGDTVRATGMLGAISPPLNPGETDGRPWASARGVAARLRIDSPALVAVLDEPRSLGASAESIVRRAAASLRTSARSWLLPDSREADDAPRALVAALLLGEREPAMADLEAAFTRLGLSHILSISGLNLVMLAGAVLLAMRLLGERPTLRLALTASAVILYMLVIPVRAPVLRAGLTVLGLLAAEAAGRRYDRLSTLGWIMLAVLIWQPMELWSAGFQLSFGVVAALIALATPLRERLFGPRPPADTLRWWMVLTELTKDASAAALCAWAASAPLILYHVGIVSPLGAIATLIVAPLVTFIMGAGYLALVVATFIPALGRAVTPILHGAAEALASAVLALDTLPGSVIHLPRITALWTVLATGAICAWMLPGELTRRRAHILVSASAVALGWLGITLASVGLPDAVPLRIDTIAVGDGACHLVRSGRDAMLIDCGSLRLTIGRRDLPRALRELGAWRIPTALVTHANLDHYSALPEIAPIVGLRTVLVSPAFLSAVEQKPDGPASAALAMLRAQGVEVRPVSAGHTFTLGQAHARLLWPPPADPGWTDNDSSIVTLLELPGGPAHRALFCGDIGPEAITELMAREPGLRADWLEAPHHGSFNGRAALLVSRTRPELVVQSTGPQRLNDPRWTDAKSRTRWLTTATDGALSVEFFREDRPRARVWSPAN